MEILYITGIEAAWIDTFIDSGIMPDFLDSIKKTLSMCPMLKSIPTDLSPFTSAIFYPSTCHQSS